MYPDTRTDVSFMKGKHKKFEKVLYNKYDAPAKEAISRHLEHTGHVVTVPPENFGPDLYSYWGPRKMYHEVEVSRIWPAGKDFQFGTGSIPERKIRLVTKIGGCELFFWMLRMDYKKAVVFSADVALDEQWLVEVPNRKIEAGEYFYRPPLKLGKEIYLARI